MTISMVMTVLNEADSLPTFLETLQRQTRRPDELVVVDGGSTDNTVTVLEEWGMQSGIQTRLHIAPGASISEGRNKAIAMAAGDMVAVTDGGTTLRADWLQQLAAAAEPGVDVVSGWFEPQYGNFWAGAIGATITPLLSEIDPENFLPSSRSLLFRRELWQETGGYPEWLDYCEDLLFDLAMKRAGAQFAFAPDAVVSWDARSSVGAYVKQYYRYARGDGKAGLWGKRHAVRYGSYALGVGLLAFDARRGPSVAARSVLAVGGAAYVNKYAKRIFVRREQLGDHWPAALALVPVLMLVGDAAKMAGYPVGVWWRHTRKPKAQAGG